MKILIEDLEFYAIIGILEKERLLEQKIIINLYIDYEYKNSFLDYVDIIKFVKKHMQTKKFKLLEEALISISENLKKRYPQIKKIKLMIKKPQILNNCSVGLQYTKKW